MFSFTFLGLTLFLAVGLLYLTCYKNKSTLILPLFPWIISPVLVHTGSLDFFRNSLLVIIEPLGNSWKLGSFRKACLQAPQGRDERERASQRRDASRQRVRRTSSREDCEAKDTALRRADPRSAYLILDVPEARKLLGTCLQSPQRRDERAKRKHRSNAGMRSSSRIFTEV